MFELEEALDYQMSIKIVGIGRKGAKAVSKMTQLHRKCGVPLCAGGTQAEMVGLSAHNRTHFLDSIVCRLCCWE